VDKVNHKTLAVVAASFAAGAYLGPSMMSIAWAQFRSIETTSLARADLSGWCEGKEVTVDLQEYGAGTSGLHFHPAYSFAWVIEGSQIKTVRGQTPVTAGEGELLTEAPMEVHETVTAAPAKVLLFGIAEKGKPITVRVP